MNQTDHPVWSVYDLYRTSRLNVKYYSAKLHRAEIMSFWMDFILLATAPSSAIAGLWFWDNPIGKECWKYLGGVAAFIAILKPILNFIKKIKIYEELRSGFKTLEHDLHEIKELITIQKKYDENLQKEFQKALKRKGVLAGKEPDSKENKKLKKKLVEEVLKELPTKSFYIPTE